MSGFILLYRSLLVHPLWTRGRFTPGQAWVDLLLMASHADHEVLMGNRVIEVKRGEVLTSQIKLAARWRWDRETVRRFFRGIGSLNMLRIRTSKDTETGYTIITIVNYEAYQADGRQQLALTVPSDAPSDAPSDPASVPHPCPIRAPLSTRDNKGNKKKEPPGGALGLSLEEFLAQMNPMEQEIVRQIVAAIASTRKTGKVSPAIIATEVSWWSQHPLEQVLAGMRTYLAKGYADQGKREAYLRGIIRNNQNGQGGGQDDGKPSLTPGWQAIQRAALAMTEEDLQP